MPWESRRQREATVQAGVPFTADGGAGRAGEASGSDCDSDGGEDGGGLWVVRVTGEAFDDYGAFLRRVAELRRPTWACRFTGAARLTYEAALAAEAASERLIAEFPPELAAPALAAAHHVAVEAPAVLVTRVVNALKLHFLPGEKAKFIGEDGVKHTCVVAAAASGDGTYPVTLTKGGTAQVPAASLQRLRSSLRRDVAQRWLLSTLVQQQVGGIRVWAAPPHLAQRFGLPQDVPPEVVAKGAAAAARQARRTDVPEATEGTSAASAPAPAEAAAAFAATAAAAAETSGVEMAGQLPQVPPREPFFPPGSIKAVCLELLRDVGPGGLTITELMKRAQAQGKKWWQDADAAADGLGNVQSAHNVLHKCSTFVRVASKTFALRSTGAEEVELGKGRWAGRPVTAAPGADGGPQDGKLKAAIDAAVAARQRVGIAESALERARASVRESAVPTKTPAHVLTPEEEAMFELPEHLREYSGAPDDRQALMAHKLKAEKERVRLERRRELYIQEKKRHRREQRLKQEALDEEVQEAEDKVIEAKKHVARCLAKVELLNGGVNGNGVAAVPELQPTAAEAGWLQRERKLQLERMETEQRRRQEVRFPIEDSHLPAELKLRGLPPSKPLPRGAPLDDAVRFAEEIAAHHFLKAFAKPLDLGNTFALKDVRALTGSPSCSRLVSLFEALINSALPESNETRRQARWRRGLTKTTWPAVLRDMISWRLECGTGSVIDGGGAVAGAERDAVDSLGRVPFDKLPAAHVATLLRMACDEALASAEVRDELEERIERASRLGTERRAENAERNRKEKEKADARKEQRKEQASELAPSFELPSSLRVFHGDPRDKEQYAAWKAEADAKQAELDEERAEWEVKMAKKRAREADKLARETEKRQALRKKREREHDLQDGKVAVRISPIGRDRDSGRYYWNVGGLRGALYVEDTDGKWSVFRSEESLDKLIAALDVRGVREKALREVLVSRYDTICEGIAQAAKGASEEEPKPDGRWKTVETTFDAEAVEEASTTLLRLQNQAAELGAERPDGAKWGPWVSSLKNAGAAEIPALTLELDDALWDFAAKCGEEGTDDMDVENGDYKEADEESEEEEEEEEEDAELDDPDGYESDHTNQDHLWRTNRERGLWRAGVQAAKTPAAAAYGVAVLDYVATPFLTYVAKELRKRQARVSKRKAAAGTEEPRKVAKA